MNNKELNFVTKNHNLTKRNYLNRMINSKVKCMIEAKKIQQELLGWAEKIWIWRI